MSGPRKAAGDFVATCVTHRHGYDSNHRYACAGVFVASTCRRTSCTRGCQITNARGDTTTIAKTTRGLPPEIGIRDVENRLTPRTPSPTYWAIVKIQGGR